MIIFLLFAELLMMVSYYVLYALQIHCTNKKFVVFGKEKKYIFIIVISR